jgi:alanyl-tRNA synthetase
VSRLYYTEPWRREFDATVVAVTPTQGGLRVRLDRTAFYPTSGGQPHDTGVLGESRVVEVSETDEGDVDHLVTGGPLAVGQRVEGRIDWPRRFDHMQQHTGQHVLSAALHRLYDVRTMSFHLGADVSTIDLARDLSPAEIAGAAGESNRIVWEDRPVTIRFVSAQEVVRLPLRKEPVKDGRLRLIEVEDFDLSACGGTHVSRTGAIGMIAIRAWERLRGGTRLTFVCGGRALAAFDALRDVVDASARPLTVHPRDLPAAIERLQEERKALQREGRVLAERLAEHEGARLAAGAETIGDARAVLVSLDGYDANGLKAVAAAAVRGGADTAVVLSTARPLLVVVARGAAGGGVDCGALVKALVGRFGGKGGGRPDLAQGGGMDAAPEAVLAAARVLIAGREP